MVHHAHDPTKPTPLSSYKNTQFPASRSPLPHLLRYLLRYRLTSSSTSLSLTLSLSASKDSRSVVVAGLISSKGIMSSYYSGRFDSHKPHFLESCFLCGKPLGYNSDIFMYRGNTPFCSKECRQEQIEIDESLEKKSWKLSSSSSASRSIRKSDTNESSPNETVRTGTVVVA